MITKGGSEPAEPFTGDPPCQDCLDEYEDVNPSEPEFDDKIPPVTENITKYQLEQNQKLFTELIDEDDANPSPDPLAENYAANGFSRLYNLLAKSMRITIQGCDGFVDSHFYSQVLKAMMILLDKSNHTQVDIGIEEFKKVDSALDICKQTKTGDKKGFTLVGTKCNNLAKVEGTMRTGKQGVVPYSLKAKSFRWYTETDGNGKIGPKYDPIVEAAWDAVDFVHGFCFSSFTNNFNYHHIYTMAMEALFPKFPIQQRWIYPAVVKNNGQFWNNVLQTTDIKQTMRNLDACAIAAYMHTPYIYRLDKPFYQMPDDAALDPPTPNATVGWSGSITEYWDMYNKRGGFASVAEGIGTCLKSIGSQAAVIHSMKTNCTELP